MSRQGRESEVATCPARGVVIGATLLCASLAILALGASPALANRTLATHTAGGNSVAFEANDNVWISDSGQSGYGNPGQNGIYEYDAYPSQTLLDVPDTLSVWAYYILDLQLAVDQANGEVFVAQSNGRTVDIFDQNGVYSHSWTAINGSSSCFNCTPIIHVAIDNSNTYSKGRVYLSLTSPENDVEALDAAQRPVDFPATASYIHNNKLSGTPSGAFGEVGHVAVDSNGNLYVTDIGEQVVDEFDSSGTFVRTLPCSGCSDGYPVGTGGVGVDPTNGNILVGDGSNISEYDSSGNLLETISDGGAPAVNSQGYLYSGSGSIYTPNKVVPSVTYRPVSSPTTTSGTLNANIDPNGGGDVTTCHFEYGTDTSYGTTVPCSPDPNSSPPGSNFSSPQDVSAAISGLTAETTYHYRVVVTNVNGTKYGTDQTFTTGKVPGLSTDPATNLTATGATLHASFVGDGSSTHYYFEWGPTRAYGNQTAAPPGDDAGSPSGPSRTALSTDLSGLAPYSTYHYRVVATNGSGTTNGQDQMFTTTPGAPTGQDAAVTAVHADRAVFHGQVNPNGADTTVHFEYVDDATFQQSGWTNATKTSPDIGIGMSKHFQSASQFVDGLSPATLYHYRVVGTNEAGSGSNAATFRTFAFTPSFKDPCPNAHVRQQTGASLLLDCRAYELVSASNSGGYDVESNLVAGQTPFGGYPNAENPSQVLYGVHDGGIPGTGNPTNNGVDPYVATRSDSGWSTKYVGVPADNPYAGGPFSSTLAEADPSLDTFAFGGLNICSPCFKDGKTGVPVHLPDGSLVQGMAGSMDPGPSAKPEGFIGKHLSGDGSHLVFGSTSKFEPDGNSGGDVSIYDRNLKTGLTHVVSKLPAGGNIPCLLNCASNGIGELDISNNGSRIVIGQLLSEEEGAKHWRLYMNIGDSNKTVELTPGTTKGVVYDGMTADGSKVFFTTVDPLLPADEDHSIDLYMWSKAGEEQGKPLTLISTGAAGTGNIDSCDPSANTVHEHWNTTGTEENCGVVAVGGGGGVAKTDGSVYFLSPEKLDVSGNGVQNAPNLYIARPGSAPHFIRTLESSANAPIPPPVHPYLRSFGSFENSAGVAIDHSSGDFYVLDIGNQAGTGYVYKFDPSGHPVLSFGSNGKLTVGGMYGLLNLPTELAVDQSNGDLYVPDLLDGVVNRFNSSGSHIAQISVGFPTGVAVDQANGHVYVVSLFGEAFVFDASGAPITSFSTIFSFPAGPTGVAVDSTGKVYVVNGGGFAAAKGTTEIYDSSGNDLGQLSGDPSKGVAVDPSNDHVYVDQGNQVVEFDSSGNPVGVPTGSGLLAGSIGLGVNSGTLGISNPGQANVASYGPAVTPSDPSTDNPVVVDSVSSAATRNTADFQVSPSGNYAVFTSTLPLTGYDNAAHREIFRYDAPADQLDCASCNPTGEQATGEATLASNGSSLTNDGRVFFNSTEGLVDRDLNNNMDVYEWEKGVTDQEGTVQLISTGTSPLDSGLLGVSADGTDAYFFTYDTLVPTDQNGDRVKIYDARANGGFPQVPPSVPCQASDECHGAGSPTPPAPVVRSITGSGGNRLPAATCKAGFIRKHGKCVRKHHHMRRRHHKAHHHG